MGNGAQVHIFQLAADGHATRQARDLHPPALERFTNDMGGGLAFRREIGGQDDFLHRAIAGASPVKSAEQQPLAAAAADPQPMVMLVSLDGFRREYLSNADDLGLSIPNIRQLMRQGRRDRLHLHPGC